MRCSSTTWHIDCLGFATVAAHGRGVKRIDIMDTRTPDITLPLNAGTTAEGADVAKRDDDARAEQAELEQLAERVSAARSIY